MAWTRTLKKSGFIHYKNPKGEGRDYDALIEKHGGTVYERAWSGPEPFEKVHKPKTWSVLLRKNSDSLGTERFLAKKEGFKTKQEALGYFNKQKRKFK